METSNQINTNFFNIVAYKNTADVEQTSEQNNTILANVNSSELK